jgi:phosphoglycerol transferase
MYYPEHGPLYSMGGYEHLKAYFHTSTLRWSYGSAIGRQGYYWNLDLVQSSPEELIQRLGNFGFSAIYIDKFGFNDGAKSLIEQLSQLLSQKPLVSENDRYATFFLPKAKVSNPPDLAEPYQLGDTIDFSSNGHPLRFYSLGWSLPEPWGTWTSGQDARLVMQLKNYVPTGDILLSATTQAFINEVHPQLDVNIFINDTQVGQWTFVYGQHDDGKREVIIPADLITKQNPLEIRFQILKAKSPAELGISNDGRKLGIGMRELRLSDIGSKEQ